MITGGSRVSRRRTWYGPPDAPLGVSDVLLRRGSGCCAAAPSGVTPPGPHRRGYPRAVSLRGGEGGPPRWAPGRRASPGVVRSATLAPLLAVLGSLLVAVVGLLAGFRPAGLVLAAVLVVAAVARLTLPAPALGTLAVRSRGADVATCLVLGVGVVVLSLTAPS